MTVSINSEVAGVGGGGGGSGSTPTYTEQQYGLARFAIPANGSAVLGDAVIAGNIAVPAGAVFAVIQFLTAAGTLDGSIVADYAENGTVPAFGSGLPASSGVQYQLESSDGAHTGLVGKLAIRSSPAGCSVAVVYKGP